MLLPGIINYLDTAQVQLCWNFVATTLLSTLNAKYWQSMPKI